jgi:hypothetical protein
VGGWGWFKQAFDWQSLRRDLGRSRGVRLLAGGIVALVLATTIWYWASGSPSRPVASVAAVEKRWPSRHVRNDVMVETRTKCVESVLSYLVVLIPPQPAAGASTLSDKSDTAAVLTDRLRRRLKTVHLGFHDKDGRAIGTFDIAMDDFVRMYSTNADRPVTLQAVGARSCDPDSYVRAAELKVSFTERSP